MAMANQNTHVLVTEEIIVGSGVKGATIIDRMEVKVKCEHEAIARGR